MQCVSTEGLQFSLLYLTFKLDGHGPRTGRVEVTWDKLICIGTELCVHGCLHSSCCCYRKLWITCSKTHELQQSILRRGLLKENNNFLLVMAFLNDIFLPYQSYLKDLICAAASNQRSMEIYTQRHTFILLLPFCTTIVFKFLKMITPTGCLIWHFHILYQLLQ